ncbi:MAG TPA: CerR family C-terminal domain-containing protein [Steroidobacteraceae bacterium]|nr:CerR family C-terminal domain-containing protein [Steroidobacteraceae bacterium]
MKAALPARRPRARNIAARRRPRPAAGARPRRLSTRQQLLEAAGRVFAEKGFDAATGKEICRRAGANAAAVVYHFGGMEQLYAAVLVEARGRLVSLEKLTAVVAGERTPEEKLAAFIGLLVRALAGPASQSWAARLIGREIVAPPKGFDPHADHDMPSRARLLKSVVAEITGLPVEHPVVARAAVSVLAPCAMLLLVDRKRLDRAFPAFNIRPETAEDIIRQMTHFALAGLAAIAAAQRAG